MRTQLSLAGLAGLAVSAHAAGNGTHLGLVRTTSEPQVPPAYPIGLSKEPFAKPAGQLFDINGTVGYFAGTNAWWLAHLSKNEDVDTAIREILKTKYKVVRVWAFGDIGGVARPAADAVDPGRVWFQQHPRANETATHEAMINYGPEGLQRLDYVVSQAERHGLKLVLPFINNWGDYGGMPLYAATYGGDAAPGTTFYGNERSQRVYRDYVRVIVERYRASPAVFSWQLCNEPRCTGCDTDVVHAWAANVSAYIKTLDPHHMVSLGDEGWFAPADGFRDAEGEVSSAYGGRPGVDFVANLNISTLDYGTFHLYPSTWGYAFSWGNLWIRQHAVVGDRRRKPVVLEEYGSPDPADHAAVLVPWQRTVLNSSLAADQVWQFGPANLTLNATAFGDPFSVYYGRADYKIVATEHAQAMLAKKVAG